jgi:glycosyltransferase involved in cell wall biosynthesis
LTYGVVTENNVFTKHIQSIELNSLHKYTYFEFVVELACICQLEAMYCNTPVVAYDVGGISEVVKNKETGLPAEGHFSPKVGLLVKAGDEEGFVKAVQEVLTLPKEALQQLTENAHQLVVREYDIIR